MRPSPDPPFAPTATRSNGDLSGNGNARMAADRVPRPSWLTGAPGHWVLVLHIQPGARVTQVLGEHGDALKLRIAAPPVEGRANEALLKWLAGRLGLPLRELNLIAGASSRAKRIVLNSDLPAVEVVARLLGDGR